MNRQLTGDQIEQFRRRLAGLPDEFLEPHLRRLDADYFDEFTPEEIRAHVESIRLLSTDLLCTVDLVPAAGDPGRFFITVAGLDFPGLFALLSGLLTLYGFNIRSGSIFTYARWRRDADAPPPPYRIQRKKIIDRLEVLHRKPETLAPGTGEIFRDELNRYLLQIQKNEAEAVRSDMSRRMGEWLAGLPDLPRDKLFPIEIDAEPEEDFTVLRIRGEDTPAFLFSLSNAMSLQGISIHKLLIRTEGARVDDTLLVTDAYDRPIRQPERLDRLKAAVALIKQFTLLLPFATDTGMAMRQFDQFISEAVFGEGAPVDFLDLNHHALLASLAAILGAGPYLWEEFVRMQYRSLLPLLRGVEENRRRKTAPDMCRELDAELAAAPQGEAFRALNAWKDRELFRIDMLYLIHAGRSFVDFSTELTDLAETIIRAATGLLQAGLSTQFGEPLVDGRPCAFAILALGKLGGVELGYASDIEIVLVYEDAGTTGGPGRAVSNAEYFNRLVEGLKASILAKQDGIFEIDLRLRPDGAKGELASSFRRWCEYYARGGPAYDYERQALIRLRPVLGPADFCARVTAARDAILYAAPPIPHAGVVELRNRQIQALVRPGTRNAKFSEGGLADAEYAVQFLQLRHGAQTPELRTPNIIRAMEVLLEHAHISPSEFEKLYNGYAFLRRLINALRMVSGHARDLVIPPAGSEAFRFLARRLGYVPRRGASPEDQLTADIAANCEAVRGFFVRRFVLDDDTPPPESGLPELLVHDLPPERVEAILAPLGVTDCPMVLSTLKNLMRALPRSQALPAVLVLAQRHLRASPSPERAIINLERLLLNDADAGATLGRLLFNPEQIEWLVLVFGYSEFLSDLLVSQPGLLPELSTGTALYSARSFEDFDARVRALPQPAPGAPASAAAEALCQYRNREMLRIGLRDIYLNVDLADVVRELSALADVLVRHACAAAARELGEEQTAGQMTVIALGKLGGRELNYSSDIDVAFVRRAEAPQARCDALANNLTRLLTDTGRYGKLFRVDARLRPYGDSGPLTGSFEAYCQYYEREADGWELQAWLKARPVAGDLELGRRLVRRVHELIVEPRNQARIGRSMEQMRARILEQLGRTQNAATHVKLSPGGIRTIEFMVQHHQVVFGGRFPDLPGGNTLTALDRLLHHRLIDGETHRTLSRHYRFLRTLEHRLQLFGLRQTHVIPEDGVERTKLAIRMGFESRAEESAAAQLMNHFNEATAQIQQMSEAFFSALPPEGGRD